MAEIILHIARGYSDNVNKSHNEESEHDGEHFYYGYFFFHSCTFDDKLLGWWAYISSTADIYG
ncbi:hypothetical protein M088_0309 [Bacteroides ovatus str. 3725 D1 iv]|jgi:hypothetical protein|nr:hypothetical protein M088_0309 [Bacteroides ovatus str. 3725 D1 iv]